MSGAGSSGGGFPGSPKAGRSSEGGEPLYELESIVGRRVEPDGSTSYKIRWRFFSPDDDTWEPVTDLPPDWVAYYNFVEDLKEEHGKVMERTGRIREAIRRIHPTFPGVEKGTSDAKFEKALKELENKLNKRVHRVDLQHLRWLLYIVIGLVVSLLVVIA